MFYFYRIFADMLTKLQYLMITTDLFQQLIFNAILEDKLSV